MLKIAGNLLLEDTIERYYVDLEWADEAHGLFLVRGENVVLLGEIVLEPLPCDPSMLMFHNRMRKSLDR